LPPDPYLQRFVQEFTETNNGKAFFATLDKLGAFIFKISKAEEERQYIKLVLPGRREA
jgi:hypothetical protein